jgi:uncharacterized protein YqeY
MTIKERLQEAMKDALRSKDQFRLECLRMAKGALLLKEKEGAGDLTDEKSIAAIRAEIKKRQQSAEIYRQHGREDEAKSAEAEVAIFEEFLPKQLNAEETEARVIAYLAKHPDLNHAGKLTGAMKKELGDLVDGKILNEVCKRLVEGA